MLELVTRTAKLTPYSRRIRTGAGVATAYFYEPDHYDPIELGSLFVVIEVLAGKNSQELVDLVIQTVADNYYSVSDTEQKPAAADKFEEAIKALNQELSEYTSKGNGGWVGKMSAIVGVFAAGELHLSQTGSAEAYLYRGGKPALISNNLSGRESFRPSKTFANIASGSLKQSDKILMTTPALMHQVTKKDLPDLMNENSANSVVQKLSDQIEADATTDRIAALVVEVTTADLLAMNVIPDEPEAVFVGQPQNLVDSLKPAAEPVLQQMLSTVKTVARVLWRFCQHRLWPWMQSAGRRLAAVSLAATQATARGVQKTSTEIRRRRSN